MRAEETIAWAAIGVVRRALNVLGTLGISAETSLAVAAMRVVLGGLMVVLYRALAAERLVADHAVKGSGSRPGMLRRVALVLNERLLRAEVAVALLAVGVHGVDVIPIFFLSFRMVEAGQEACLACAMQTAEALLTDEIELG